MAIDVQQPNLLGLSNLSRGTEMMNLFPTGTLGLQALQQKQAQTEAQNRDDLARMQMQQQGELALRQQNIQQQALGQQGQQQDRQGLLSQQDQAFRQQQAGQAANQFQQSFGLQQQQAAQQAQQVQNQQNMQQQQINAQNFKQHMDTVDKLNDKQIQDRGGFASYALMSMQSAKSPDDAQQYWNSISKEAVSKSYMSQSQADQLSQMPLSQRMNAMKGMIISLGATKEYKDMQPAPDKAKAASGVQLSVAPDGTVNYSSTPTATETTNTQKALNTQNQMLDKLDELKNTYQAKYLTYSGRGTKTVSQEADKLQGIPVIGEAADYAAQKITGLDKEDQAKYISDSSQYLHSAGQIFQQYIQSIAGSRPSAERVKQLEALFANPSMSPVEYKAGLDQLIRDITTEKQGNQNVLNKGFDTTPSKDPNAGKRNYLKSLQNPDHSPRYSDDQIDTFLNGGH